MKDTTSSPGAAAMTTIKKLDDEASRQFWDSVEEIKQGWQTERPSWYEEFEERKEHPTSAEASSAPSHRLNCD
jgi:hypothetical protein